jgi:SAM-dependent methyltransferase
VLDVGAGSGRDLAVLRRMGFDAYGVEPNDTMRAHALRIHPELAGRLQPGALPEIGFPFGGGFDGILCSAVVMHLPPADLPRCAESLRALVNPQGRVLFSLPFMRPNLLDDERDPDGRYFQNHTPESLTHRLEKAGFSLAGNWDNGEHAGTRWSTLLFELTGR